MTSPYGRKQREIKKPLDESERGEWKSWLKAQHSENEDHGIWFHHFMAKNGEKMETVTKFIFLDCKITADGDCSHEIKRCLFLGRKPMTKLDSILKSRNQFADKGPYSQSYGFSSSHVQMWELDHKEGWALKNWCFQIVVLEKTPESPLDSKVIKPVHSKGNQLWIFIGRTDSVVPILWPPEVKSRLFRKDPDAGKDWRQE